VAKERGFSRAGGKTPSHPAAISQSVRKLEEETGDSYSTAQSMKECLRKPRRVLFDYAERLLNLRGEATEALTELRQMQRGRLVIRRQLN